MAESGSRDEAEHTRHNTPGATRDLYPTIHSTTAFSETWGIRFVHEAEPATPGR
jgi:hypothetical protein